MQCKQCGAPIKAPIEMLTSECCGCYAHAPDRQVAVYLNPEELLLLVDLLRVDAWRMDDAAGEAEQAGERGRMHEARSRAAGSRALRVKLTHYAEKAVAQAAGQPEPPMAFAARELLRRVRDAQRAAAAGDGAEQQYALSAALTEIDVIVGAIRTTLQQQQQEAPP